MPVDTGTVFRTPLVASEVARDARPHSTGFIERQVMSTKATLAHHHADQTGEPSWHFYEEVFEPGVVYLELEGVSVELRTREQGGADVVVRLPVETARQLGLPAIVRPQRWALVDGTDRP